VRLQGLTDGESYTTLLEPPNPSYIGNELEYYLVDRLLMVYYFPVVLFGGRTNESSAELGYVRLYVYSE